MLKVSCDQPPPPSFFSPLLYKCAIYLLCLDAVVPGFCGHITSTVTQSAEEKVEIPLKL